MARILVIDDDSEVRTVLDLALKASGHDVILATDGEEGELQYRLHSPDLVLIDLFMPKREGLETIRDIRRDFPHANIVAMSGATTGDMLLRVARRLGAVAILEKPFLLDQLAGAVETALRSTLVSLNPSSRERPAVAA